jgi:cytochrome c oxidase subunit 2
LRPTGPPPSRRSRSPRRALGIGAVLGFVLLACTACNTATLPRFAFPTPATKEAPRILLMWQGSWLAALITGGVVWGLIAWTCIFHRRKAGNEVPIQTRYNLPIEVLYTVIPFVIVAVLFFFTARDESILLDTSKKPDMTVNVVGRQWSWSFNYLDDQVYDDGTPAARPQLWLPVDKRVKFVLTSPDVIHSFWIPSFLFKLDVFPGRTNTFELTPNKIGHFEGKCAELCGSYHARMLFEVYVVSEADYRAHVAQLRHNGQVGQLPVGVLPKAEDRERQYTLEDSMEIPAPDGSLPVKAKPVTSDEGSHK